MYDDGVGVERNVDQALYWFEKGAEQGDALMQYKTAALFYEKDDNDKAFFWCSKSAKQGDKEAQYQLGKAYSNGEGTPINKQAAKYWFQQATA